MSRQRKKVLRECPSCHQRSLRPEYNGKVEGVEVCDQCVVDHRYRSVTKSG